MYKLLLCWRYLRTRYLAMVCIVSVTLGVATLIVVNSVMNGFSTKLRDRLHGLLSDVVVEAYDYEGFHDPVGKMELIRNDPFLNSRIESMTATLEIFAMLQFTFRDTPMMRPVRVVGIEPDGRSAVGGFAEFLVHGRGRGADAFAVRPEAAARYRANQRLNTPLGWQQHAAAPPPLAPGEKPPPDPPDSKFDEMPPGVVIGYAIGHFRTPDPGAPGKKVEVCTLKPGDEVVLTTVSGARLAPVHAPLVVTDYLRTEMSEHDAQYVFVPIEYLQKLRTMENRATSIQIRLKDYRDARAVCERLRALFAHAPVEVQTWEQKQGPLLSAIAVEKGLLNVLLFMIILVAGFGILAIFSMIVVEKTKDIGILKALGASNLGVMNIFLSYGLLLGVVGATFGTAVGITMTVYINEIEWGLARLTGQEMFPRDTYYFDKIPTDIQPLHVLTVNAGAVLIAVLFSVLPALRAALLHPVRALRYE